MPDATNHPWVLWAAVLGIILPTLAAAFPKILGPIGQAWADWAQRQRTAALASDDHDIAEMKRAMDNLSKMLSEERALNEVHRRHIMDLYRYILAAQRDPHRLDDPVPDPGKYDVFVEGER